MCDPTLEKDLAGRGRACKSVAATNIMANLSLVT